MSRQDRAPGPVPNRWLHCPRKSSDLIVKKFLAFKTPLSDEYDSVVPPECRFPPRMLFEICKAKKIKLGLWINLTNTTRYYSEDEIEGEGCRYVKFPLRGHGETPSEEQKDSFIELVHNFINYHPLECIGVHCTHGFNRTGFLIVSYLVEKMDFSLEKATELFASVRSPGIYKGDYLKELYERYDDGLDTPPPPSLPDWCYEMDDSESSNASTSYDNRSHKNHNHKSNKSKAAFMKGVPGVEVVTEQPKMHHLQQQIKHMCKWKRGDFPGCQPVSMDLVNIQLLHEKPYRVSWKADGTRYMMLIKDQNEVYFFDRDNNVFKINGLSFPHRKDLRRHLRDTLLDGEMVIDKVNGENIPRYLAYDIITFEKENVGAMPFYPTRLHCLEHEIIKPRYLAMENGLINKTKEPFSVRKKDFWEIAQAASLLGEKFARTLSHEPDGLIFQPSKEPYTAGRCDEVLKWKPLDMNSIDFRLRIVKEGGQGIIAKSVGMLYVGHNNVCFGKIKYTKALKDLDNKIIECKWEDNQWKYMRERTDKSFPNGLETANAVLESIRNPVTKEKLLDYIQKYRFRDDSEMMPPPSKIRR